MSDYSALIAEARHWVAEEAEASGPLDWHPPVARLADALEQARSEVEQWKRIRALLIRSLVRATGETEEAVSDAPLTCAVRAAEKLDGYRTHIEAASKLLGIPAHSSRSVASYIEELQAENAQLRQIADRHIEMGEMKFKERRDASK